MAALATVARWGFRIATVGSSAVLALAVGTLPAAAARIGFYADATAGAEQLVGVVGGVTGPAFQRSGSAVNLTLPGTLTGTQHVSTIAIGTAPLVVTSTTVVPNLNVSQLLGGTWAVPGAIGATTRNTGQFTTLNANGTLSTSAGANFSSSVVIFYIGSTTDLTKGDSQGVLLSAKTDFGIFLNGASTARPELSFIRGGRTYPECSFREHTLSDTGGEIWVGTGIVAPTRVVQFIATGVTVTGAVIASGAGTFSGAVSGTTGTFSGLTSGRVTFAGASGLLSDNSAFTFATGTTNALTLGSSSRITITTALTDISATYGYAGTYTVNVTASAVNNSRGFSVSTAKSVQAGVADTGSHTGFWIEAFRNYVGTADSTGSLTSLRALNVNFGHFNTAAVAPVTTTITGITANIYYMTGTISSLYGINVAQGQTGGTVTDLRAIYITTFSGTISTLTGLYIGDQTAGSTSNYAIQTGQGKVVFGDVTDATAIGTAGIVFVGGLTVAKTFGLGSVSAPGSPFDGQVWQDSTQKALIARLDGVKQAVSSALFTATADATVANTVTETSIIGTGVGTKTLPANFFVAGKTIRITVQGYLSSTANPTMNIKIKYGSTVLVASGAVAQVGTPTTKGFCVEVIITCRTTGATGTVSAQGYWQYATNVQDITSTATTTIDTTASSALDVTATWGVAAAGNTITGTVTTVEVLN